MHSYSASSSPKIKSPRSLKISGSPQLGSAKKLSKTLATLTSCSAVPHLVLMPATPLDVVFNSAEIQEQQPPFRLSSWDPTQEDIHLEIADRTSPSFKETMKNVPFKELARAKKAALDAQAATHSPPPVQTPPSHEPTSPPSILVTPSVPAAQDIPDLVSSEEEEEDNQGPLMDSDAEDRVAAPKMRRKTSESKLRQYFEIPKDEVVAQFPMPPPRPASIILDSPSQPKSRQSAPVNADMFSNSPPPTPKLPEWALQENKRRSPQSSPKLPQVVTKRVPLLMDLPDTPPSDRSDTGETLADAQVMAKAKSQAYIHSRSFSLNATANMKQSNMRPLTLSNRDRTSPLRLNRQSKRQGIASSSVLPLNTPSTFANDNSHPASCLAARRERQRITSRRSSLPILAQARVVTKPTSDFKPQMARISEVASRRNSLPIRMKPQGTAISLQRFSVGQKPLRPRRSVKRQTAAFSSPSSLPPLGSSSAVTAPTNPTPPSIKGSAMLNGGLFDIVLIPRDDAGSSVTRSIGEKPVHIVLTL